MDSGYPAGMRQDEVPEIANKRKMYVVVRRDLAPGLRAAQAAHAVAEMCLGFAHSTFGWNSDPDGNYLIILEVDNEAELESWYLEASRWGFPRTFFREPDLNGEMTAFACLPNPEDNDVFHGLPLAFRSRWTRIKGRIFRKGM